MPLFDAAGNLVQQSQILVDLRPINLVPEDEEWFAWAWMLCLSFLLTVGWALYECAKGRQGEEVYLFDSGGNATVRRARPRESRRRADARTPARPAAR